MKSNTLFLWSPLILLTLEYFAFWILLFYNKLQYKIKEKCSKCIINTCCSAKCDDFIKAAKYQHYSKAENLFYSTWVFLGGLAIGYFAFWVAKIFS